LRLLQNIDVFFCVQYRQKHQTLHPKSTTQIRFSLNKKLFQTMVTHLQKVLFLMLVLCVQTLFAQTREEGFTALQLDKLDKAITIYSALTQANPADQEAWLNLGNAQLAKGMKDKALESFNSAFNAKAEGAMALIANGRILLLRGDMAEADKQFAKAAKAARKDATAYRMIGESYLFFIPNGSTKPNFARAEGLLKDAYEAHTKDWGTQMMLGYAYKEMGNGGSAAVNYEYAAQLQPKNPLPVFMLAKVYKAAKLPEKFLEFCDKALAIDPKYAPALRGKAEHLYYGRKWEKAREALKALVANASDVTVDDEMLLANTLYRAKDYKGCSELVEKIIQKDGSKSYLRRLLGYCYYETNEYDRGVQVMNQYFNVVEAEKIIPSDYVYHGRLMVRTKGDTAMAIQKMLKAVELDSSEWALRQEIGDLYYMKKDYCSASEQYRMRLDSVEKPGGNDYYRLGVSYFYCKSDSLRYEKALTAFTKVTELAPNAGTGYFWSGQAAAKSESKLVEKFATQPELVSQFGRAKPFFDKFIEIGAADPVKNKKDLVTAYEYLSSYYFFRKEDENLKSTIAKLTALDPPIRRQPRCKASSAVKRRKHRRTNLQYQA
jgi:tetratricopeptide (TPR) repeat protein